MLTWRRLSPRRWTAPLGPLTVELVILLGEARCYVWRGERMVGEVELGAARAGVVRGVQNPPQPPSA